LYRQHQIILGLFNELLADFIYPLLMTGVVFVVSTCSFVLIEFRSVMPTPFRILISFAITVCITFELISFPVAGNINAESKRVLRTLKRSSEYKCSKFYRKKIISLEQLKIKFGSCNFLDSRTGLVIMGQTVDLTVNMLLTWKAGG
jgi:hypothetical protein